MKFNEEKIIQALEDGKYLKGDDIQEAKKSASVGRVTILDFLTSKGVISKDIIGQAIAEVLHVPYSDLNSKKPSREQVFKIPEEIAKKFRVILFKDDQDLAIFTTDDPAQENLKTELEKLFPNLKFEITFSLEEDVTAILAYYQKDLETKFTEIISEKKQVIPEILFAIFDDAIRLNASDIHFEPTGLDVLIRFRVDGLLRDAGRVTNELYENLLNRIKVQSGIRMDEHFAAQDGAMQSKHGEITLDLRVSIIPTVEGEKAVLRILSSYIQGLVLSDLGLSEANRMILETAAQKPFGMIMVTGPTGSGKTTTLYGLLKILNKSDVNITTIEDPVEYKMRGINQIQVNTATNLTFAKGLRSIVRQDPDIILVGEIRDEETAEIAVNAALTGHLLLSTFHANNAATAIPRMLDMGIEPFLLASTLELIIGQRLARKICEHCKQSITVETKEIIKINSSLKNYFKEKEHTLYKGNGCGVCGDSGYNGRTALFEIIQITPEIKELILKNPSSKLIEDLAHTQGTHSMFDDGIEKVKNGITTLEELLRVAEPAKK